MSAPDRPLPKPGIMDIAAYVPGKHAAPGARKVYKLSANETPLGPSPNAEAALRRTADRLSVYPEGTARELREAIGTVHGIDPDRILCGNGSDDLLTLICQAYLAPGDEAIVTAHGFLLYRIQTLAAGATPVTVPERDCTADVEAILAAVTERTKIVFLANPNNPTGTYLPQSAIRRLHAGLPKTVLLVLDAAYAEYVTREDYDAGLALVSASENVVMTRTFSKIYGLAALRIGWMVAPARIIDAVGRIRGPFNVNALAIAAGAAAMRDRDHVAAALEHNEAWLARIEESLTALGLTVTPTVANFVLVHFPDEPGRTAADADAFLTERGYILRRVEAYGFPNALRFTVGSEEANLGVIHALATFMERVA
ncbi:histidinol-phosphate transaminase [Pararhizobium mangrovi]|uniref:Histidinol-phosphate aminotransferase n=1 Tax=Pararhizobium mangrovi TaxID=2590452 RepID=A0A506TYX7_9HYPH|nr:histidinol-phosphate transaminase [Pararhizobium mangrovi]TPW27303.1 histidinol-phosphate transaminase [Pararhizobium mangrovi]